MPVTRACNSEVSILDRILRPDEPTFSPEAAHDVRALDFYSKMLGGATMSDGGNPLVPDVRCQAILTTPDPIEMVAKFYSEKVGTPSASGGQTASAEVKEADAKAVSTQDDSEGRPVALRVIVVCKSDTTTTLVISRADSEKETHIAWSHYRRFNG